MNLQNQPLKIAALLLISFTLFCLNVSQAQSSKLWVKFISHEYVPNCLDSICESSNSDVNEIIGSIGIVNLQLALPDIIHFPQAASYGLDRVYEIEFTADINAAIDSLNRWPLIIDYVEEIPDGQLLHTPNDYELFDNDVDIGPNWQLDLIEAEAAWDISRDVNGKIMIAVVEGGFGNVLDVNHEDLTGNAISATGSLPISDPHATFVAGCASSKTNNGLGISAIGYNASIRGYNTYSSNIWLQAVLDGCRVINCSYISSCSFVQTVANLAEMLSEMGIIIVAGAGNGPGQASCNGMAYAYPASYDHVISVSSVSEENTFLYAPGNYHHTGNDKVDICAPGYRVLSTAPGNDYYRSSGTSFASPMVAGLVALLLNINPCLKFDDIKAILQATADPIDDAQDWPGLLGAGRINAYQACLMALQIDNYGSITSNNEVWSDSRILAHDLTIENGATLTITGEVRIQEDVKIIVKPGGKLIINGGLLTNNSLCNENAMWLGIEVLGNPNLIQTNANQGEVRILNGGTIEYALVGVSLGALNPNGTPDLSTTGGFVRGYTGATFLNCKQAVRAYDYQSPNGAPNRTVFNNTTFEISEELPGGVVPQTQVQLRGVNGVVFNTSIFLNSRSDEHSIYHAGSGISSGYSGFKVTECEFENLLNGIKVKSLGFDNISVQNSTFNLNLQGVQLRYSGIANVAGNTFLVPTPNEIDYGGNTAVEPYGIYLISSTGYEVEENSFFSSEIHKNVGIAIRNSGNYSNQIYKNNFHTLEAGIIAMKDNRYDPIEGSSFYEGLIFKCNEFGDENTPLNYSIALTDEGEVAMFQGVMGVQGGGAGNIFLPICPSGTTDKEFFVEETTPITSVVVYIPYAEEETRPDCNTPTMVAVPGSVISKSTSQCPSNISTGGVIGVFQEKYMTNRDMLATIKAVYDNTANGGDTQYLLDLIANSNISSFDLRNELLLASPDVTDRVLIEAIARNPEMNPWHLAQVLLANSPLPRNVINVLEKSDVQEYYRELVLNGQNGGMTNTTIMQMEQGYFSAEVETSRMDYVRLAYFGDSTFTWNDSIIYYLSDAAGHQHKKTLLSYHIMRRQYQEAQNILNESETYQWSQDYLDVMNVIMEAFQDTSSADEVVRLNQVLLETIANEDNSEAHLAQALLESFDLATYDYDVVLPGMQPKSLKQIRNNNSGKSSFASVHPNPAQNNIYLSWNLPEGMNPEKVTLSIYNIHGKQMLSNTLNQHLGIQEIGINQWPTGMYLYQLQYDGIRLHSDKFEVFK